MVWKIWRRRFDKWMYSTNPTQIQSNLRERNAIQIKKYQKSEKNIKFDKSDILDPLVGNLT